MKKEIDRSLRVCEIQEKYGLSKATASRAKKRGWYIGSEYHQKDARTNEDAIKKIAPEVQKGESFAKAMLKKRTDLQYEDIQDAVSEAKLRTLENASNIEKKNAGRYLTKIAWNLGKRRNFNQ